MPKYRELFEQGIYQLAGGMKVFAGTTDDAFYIDLGAAFDSLNFRKVPGPGSTGMPAVLSRQQDRANRNFVADEVSGYNVNTIALQVPICAADPDRRPARRQTTRTRASAPTAPRCGSRPRPATPLKPVTGDGDWVQVQRMGNPLFNELIIGTGFKDLWSRSDPEDDAQFANFALDPLIARVAQAAYGGAFDIPTPPRADLLPLVTYAPPIAVPNGSNQVIADLLRVNTGVPPTPFQDAKRLGLLAGDPAGFPNGRRPFDDVTDIALRVVVGGVLVAGFNKAPNNRLGDGVNTNDAPRVATSPSWRQRWTAATAATWILASRAARPAIAPSTRAAWRSAPETPTPGTAVMRNRHLMAACTSLAVSGRLAAPFTPAMRVRVLERLPGDLGATVPRPAPAACGRHGPPGRPRPRRWHWRATISTTASAARILASWATRRRRWRRGGMSPIRRSTCSSCARPSMQNRHTFAERSTISAGPSTRDPGNPQAWAAAPRCSWCRAGHVRSLASCARLDRAVGRGPGRHLPSGRHGPRWALRPARLSLLQLTLERGIAPARARALGAD